MGYCTTLGLFSTFLSRYRYVSQREFISEFCVDHLFCSGVPINHDPLKITGEMPVPFALSLLGNLPNMMEHCLVYMTSILPAIVTTRGCPLSESRQLIAERSAERNNTLEGIQIRLPHPKSVKSAKSVDRYHPRLLRFALYAKLRGMKLRMMHLPVFSVVYPRYSPFRSSAVVFGSRYLRQ